jgi:hypothetical protein
MVSLQITEENARAFYRAWTSYMNDGTWSECLGESRRVSRIHATAAE